MMWAKPSRSPNERGQHHRPTNPDLRRMLELFFSFAPQRRGTCQSKPHELVGPVFGRHCNVIISAVGPHAP